MNNRPSIPAELKRQVLVEAGHRCAIHTCKQTTTEIHHIIPYEKCKKHEFDNLIALCPNCHARVHNGEIDAKSLKIYKQYLSKKTNDEVSISSLFNKHDGENKEIAENTDTYDFIYIIPIIQDSSLHELEIIMSAGAIKSLLDFRRFYSNKEEIAWGLKHEFSGEFKITYLNNKIVSLELSTHIYCSGAAHGSRVITTYNYKINPVVPIYLEDVFMAGSNYLDFISRYCRAYLVKTLGIDANINWLHEGTSPSKENFENFTFTDFGLKFIFNEYQIACYADGINHVLIPYEHIGNIINQEIIT